MLDASLRRWKDSLFWALAGRLPSSLTPTHVTIIAFLAGLASCLAAAVDRKQASLVFWALNRLLDGLDGTLARVRGLSTQLGGFLDLVADFTVYSLIPLSVVQGRGPITEHAPAWMAVAFLEATFHLNNFILFYVAAVEAKSGRDVAQETARLTSVLMKPALVEGLEAGLFFTFMILFPQWIGILSWVMSAAVGVGIVQRLVWVIPALEQLDSALKKDRKDE